MVMKIDRDATRFKQIVRGKIRENLKRYITHGEMIGRIRSRTVTLIASKTSDLTRISP